MLQAARRTMVTAAANGPQKGDRVIVAMSGGVDSSVTAKLLADHDYDLSAVFMRNWDSRDENGTDDGCEWKRDWEDVQRVCRTLDLPCEMVDLSKEYWNQVFQPSLNQWEAGQTPNPDVWCNRWIKFGSLLDHLQVRKFDWLATGHYAGTSWLNSPHSPPRPRLIRAKDRSKDQSYYLSAIKESALRKSLFPLHTIRKEEVREIARKYGLPTATRPESMGLCFVGERKKFSEFLAQYIPPKPGPIFDLDTGLKVGRHDGLWRYTIGEGAKVPGMRTRMFVAKKDVEKNMLFIVPRHDHPALSVSKLVVNRFNWIWPNIRPERIQADGISARVQFRHRMMDIPGTVRLNANDKMEISFKEVQFAVAPGQVAAIFDGDWCLGSGTISATERGL